MENVTSERRFNEIISRHKYVFVDVYAEWCGPCKRIAPEIEKMVDEYNHVKFIKFDSDELPKIANRYNVKSLPTFLFFDDEEQVGRVKGAKLEVITKMLDQMQKSLSKNSTK